MLLLIYFLCSCSEGGTDPETIAIDREYRSPRLKTEIRDAEFVQRMAWESTSEKLENGFIKQVFLVPPSLAYSLSLFDPGDSSSADPFAEPVPPKRRPKSSLREVLERAGITFPNGASVHYDEEKWALVIVNTEDQLELMKAYLESISFHIESSIHVRAEIYEVSRSQALQLIESAAHEFNHTPERDAVVRAVNTGNAKMIAIPSVVGRSGQRSKVDVSSWGETDVEAATRPGSATEEDAVDSPSMLESRLEVDVVAGADGYTLDMNLGLDHSILIDTANEGASASDAGSGYFRRASIKSTVTLTHGSYVLVGSWDSGVNSVRLVFITATNQQRDDLRPMLKVSDSEKTKE